MQRNNQAYEALIREGGQKVRKTVREMTEANLKT